MKYLNLDAYQHRLPPFYLGIEEYLVKNSEEEYFLVWSCAPSVIIGRHQVIYNEVQREYLAANDIYLARRFSGGGAVYADTHNLMYTFILNNQSKIKVFNDCLGKICQVLHDQFGLDVTYSGRNDLILNGRKISGSSFFYYGNRVIFHGTLLYDVDLEKMTKALNPGHAKLALKGIESVRQRIANLKPETTASMEDIKKALIGAFCDQEETNLPLVEIEPYQNHLASQEFIEGKFGQSNYHYTLRFGKGTIEVSMLVVGTRIAELQFQGDFFALQDLDILIKHLINIPYEKNAICDILKNVKIEDYILGLSNAEFLQLLTEGART